MSRATSTTLPTWPDFCKLRFVAVGSAGGSECGSDPDMQLLMWMSQALDVGHV